MLADAPLNDPRQDSFGFAAYANALAHLIDSEGTDTPLTLAISGRWGSGKTSLARMVEHHLKAWTAQRSGERPSITCWFDAWMHGDAPHLGAAMAGAVARVASVRRPVWRRILEPLPSIMLSGRERWRRRLMLLLTAIPLAIVVLLIPGVSEALGAGINGDLIAGGSIVVTLLLVLEAIKVVRPALDHAARFLEDPASEAARGTVNDARNQLGQLIKHATRKGRIVVFVDNLERCPPARAIEVCEVANQLLSHPGVVTVLISDMEVIEGFAGELYKAQGGAERAGREYLEKIVQIELALPPPQTADMERLLRGEAPEASAIEQDQAVEADVPPGPLDFRRMLNDEPITLVPASAIVVGGLAAFYFLVFGDASGGSSGTIPAVWIIIGTSLVTNSMGVSYQLVKAWRLRQARRTRDRVKQAIEDLRDLVDQSALEEKVVAAVNPEDADLAHTLVKTYLVDAAEELVAVEEVILRYPPDLPRGAKRVLNHARLLTQIARDRQLFGGNPSLNPEHLGEWIVLRERWPAIARAVERDPTLLGDLETQAATVPTGMAFQPQVDGEFIPCIDPELLANLLTADPKLGVIAQRLVRFEAPSAGGSNDDQATGGAKAEPSELA